MEMSLCRAVLVFNGPAAVLLLCCALLSSSLVITVRGEDDCESPASDVYALPSPPCDSVSACRQTYCSCVTGTYGAADLSCTFATDTDRPTCDTATNCLGAYIKCMNTEASKGTCTSLGLLQVGLLSLLAGRMYNNTAPYGSCQYTACRMLNQTLGNGTECPIDTARDAILCAPPVSYRAVLKIRGSDWGSILAKAGAAAAFRVAAVSDLEGKLTIVGVRIHALRSAAARRQTENFLEIDFEVPGVSSANPILSNAIRAAKLESTWLQSVSAEYSRFGGSGSLEVISITDSNAFSGSGGFWDESASDSTSTGGTGSPTGAGNGSSAGSDVSSGASTGSHQLTWMVCSVVLFTSILVL